MADVCLDCGLAQGEWIIELSSRGFRKVSGEDVRSGHIHGPDLLRVVVRDGTCQRCAAFGWQDYEAWLEGERQRLGLRGQLGLLEE